MVPSLLQRLQDGARSVIQPILAPEFWLYSAEDFPSKRKANKSFQSNKEYIQFNGFTLYNVEAHKWTPIDRRFLRVESEDFTDKRGRRVTTLDEEFAVAVLQHFTNPESPNYRRGVVVLTAEEYRDEQARKEAEDECEADNKAFRASVIAEFEAGLQERIVTGKGRGAPTPYEDECYQILGMTKPNSPEALAAQRNPGRAMAREIVDAIREADMAKAQTVANLRISPEEEKQINESIEADKEGENDTTQGISVIGDARDMG